FFVLLPLPPISTALPYTTLFRSKRISELVTANRYLSKDEMEHYPEFLHEQMERQLEYERKMLNNEPTGVVVENSPDENVKKEYRDRKSTRLNSSHVSISYAVFCL